MKIAATSVFIVSVLAFALVAQDRRAQDEEAHRQLMQRKLQLSQDVLEALTIEDYELLGRSAKELRDLAESQWTEIDTPEYRAHLKNFWVVTEGMQEAAEKESVDRVAITYLQMTRSCLNCHEYLRQDAD
jgi:hypothetical protein